MCDIYKTLTSLTVSDRCNNDWFFYQITSLFKKCIKMLVDNYLYLAFKRG